MNKEYEISVVINKNQAKKLESVLSESDFSSFEIIKMERTLYKNGGPFRARITKENNLCYYDFKQDIGIVTGPKNALESEKTYFNKNNYSVVERYLKSLGYAKHQDFIKERKSYQFDNFKIEIDYYSAPEEKIVLEIEGKEEFVNKEFEKIKSLLDL